MIIFPSSVITKVILVVSKVIIDFGGIRYCTKDTKEDLEAKNHENKLIDSSFQRALFRNRRTRIQHDFGILSCINCDTNHGLHISQGRPTADKVSSFYYRFLPIMEEISVKPIKIRIRWDIPQFSFSLLGFLITLRTDEKGVNNEYILFIFDNLANLIAYEFSF